MLENTHSQARMRPALLKRAKLDDALAEVGLRTPAYREQPGIVLLRPQYLRPSIGPLAGHATELEINLAPELDKLFAASSVQAMWYVTRAAGIISKTSSLSAVPTGFPAASLTASVASNVSPLIYT